MNRIFWIIWLLLILSYLGFNIFKSKRPGRFDERYNDIRIKVGLIEISPDFQRHNGKDAVYQKWTPSIDNTVGFYSKYVSCDSWNHGIVAENDNYCVIVDSSTVILSLIYDYKAEFNKRSFYLKELEQESGFDSFGHNSKTIRQLTTKEAKEIMNKNQLRNNWP